MCYSKSGGVKPSPKICILTDNTFNNYCGVTFSLLEYLLNAFLKIRTNL